MPSTLMGQFMEALNNPSNLEDLGFNIDGFQGGLECNVDEVMNLKKKPLTQSQHLTPAQSYCRSSNKNSTSMDS